MRAHNRQSNGQSGDQERTNAADEDDEDGDDDEGGEGLAAGEGSAEEDEWLVGGAEEVEDGPRGEEREEHEKRERVSHEGECESKRDQGYVVDAEVGGVLADPGICLGEGFGSGHGTPVEELRPGAALREALPEGGGEAGDEGAECWCGDRRRGLGGGGRRVGLRGGDGEWWWSGHWRRVDLRMAREAGLGVVNDGDAGKWEEVWCGDGKDK